MNEEVLARFGKGLEVCDLALNRWRLNLRVSFDDRHVRFCCRKMLRRLDVAWSSGHALGRGGRYTGLGQIPLSQ